LTGDGERMDYMTITSVLNCFSGAVGESTNSLPAGEISRARLDTEDKRGKRIACCAEALAGC
jgi:hypothetical protein